MVAEQAKHAHSVDGTPYRQSNISTSHAVEHGCHKLFNLRLTIVCMEAGEKRLHCQQTRTGLAAWLPEPAPW